MRITLILFLVCIFSITVFGQTTAFNYQGRLNDGTTAASGAYQMQFALFDAAVGGTQIGATVENTAVTVTNGIFSVQLDFGANAFNGADRFLQIRVRRNSGEGYVGLNPRQKIDSAPYAIRSANAASADTANNALLLGGQPASAYGTSSQISDLQALISALQTQNTLLQSQVNQLTGELTATTGGAQLWSRRFGGTSTDYGNSIAVNNNGDVFVTGFFTGTVNFGGANLTSAGSGDIFVAKYSGATGAHLWSTRFGGTLDDSGSGIKTDSEGNVFVTGYFNGTVNFGGLALTSAGSTDVFLIKLSGANGSHLWSRRFGGIPTDIVRDLSVDNDDNVLITGYFSGSADFGGLVLTSAGGQDIFAAKYSGATSSHLWSKRFGGTSNDVGNGISTDDGGNVFITGNFLSATINFGGGNLTHAGSNDGYIVKLSAADGAHLWSKRFGGTSTENSKGVATDGSGNVFVTGSFISSTIDFGGGALTNAGSSDVFLVKYDTSGNHQWSKAFGGSSSDVGNSISVDNSGNVIVTGDFQVTANFGGASLNSAGGTDIFVAKYAGNNGAHLWSRRFGSTDFDYSISAAVDGSGNVFLTGYFWSPTIDFGGGPLTNASSSGFEDIFVVKLMK